MESILKANEASRAYEQAVREAFSDLRNEIDGLLNNAMQREDAIEYAMLSNLSAQCGTADVYRTPAWLIEKQLESISQVVQQVKDLQA